MNLSPADGVGMALNPAPDEYETVLRCRETAAF
jgi:hypothetical protein